MRDLYSVLGVRRDAGADEIKAAWRTRAKSVHPDQNREDPNANQRFAEIGRAYEVLKDPKKRNHYDQQRSKVEAMEREQTIMQQRESAREAARQAAEKAKAAKANAERIMAELAKAEAEKNRAEKVAQSTAQAAQAAAAQAAAAQAAAQAKATQTPPSGQSSGGSGTASAEQPKAGPVGETPEEMVSRIFGDTPEAAAAAEKLKRENESKGEKTEKADRTDKAENADAAATASRPASIFAPVELISSLVRRFRGVQPAPEKAPDLHVEALVTIDDLLAQKSVPVTLADGRELRVPLSGVSEGHVVQLKAQGHKLPNMARGDVYATIRVTKDEKFRVDGFDIRTVLPITLENAVLGCDTQVETPAGPVDITIPAWSNSDQVIRLEGQGLPDDTGGRGAVLVELRVKLWEKPDDKVTDLMRVMREGLFL